MYRGGEQPQLVFLVVQNCEPWECAFYSLDKAALDLGDMQNYHAINNLRHAIESDDYWGDQNKLIMTLELPRWAFNQE